MVESSEQVETKTCGMCEKPIEVAKFRLHEVACSRQNYKCQKCGEVVPKADREQHELDEHTEKPDLNCDLCTEFVTKDGAALATHKKDECKNRPQAVNPVTQQPSAAANSDLQKCPYCPMEFTADQLQNHISYCGSKTKECTECFTTVQSWMMASHKETGECANIVLDRQETDDQNQLRQVMEQSAFAAENPSVQNPPQQQLQPVPAASQAQEVDDGMDENEREIARIMQEEANAIEGGGAGAGADNPAAMGGMLNQPMQEPAMDDGGIRAPDQARMQVLSGPDPYYGDHADIDYDIAYAQAQQRQQQQRINQGIVGGITGGIANAASSVASAFGNMMGYADPTVQNDAQQQQQRQQQPAGDAEGVGMTEDERQLQMAMAASMGVDQNSNVAASDNQDSNPVLGGEDEAMARAIQESMSAQTSSIDQIRQQNDLYQQQMAGGEDEDAMLARILAESQNQQ